MAYLTKADLRARVLIHLGVVGPGESPSSTDQNLVDEQIEAVIGELERFGQLEPGFNADSIPDWAQNAMRDRVAFLVAPDFRVSPERIQLLAQAAGAALALLIRHHEAYDPDGTKDDAGHKILIALGQLRPGEAAPKSWLTLVNDVQESTYAWLREKGAPGWDLDTIPEWAEEHWRDVVALRAAPLFGVVDPNVNAMLAQRHNRGLNEIMARFDELTPATTKEDLGNKVLNYLGLTAVAEEPTDAQRVVLDDGIERCVRQLERENVIAFSPEQIPEWAMLPLRDYVAYYVAPLLGRQRDQVILQGHGEGLRELRAQSAAKQQARPHKSRYF